MRSPAIRHALLTIVWNPLVPNTDDSRSVEE
jgi:hypothetical protein